MSELVLSLFPGADLLGLGFELEGFCVVAGPDIQFGRDIKNFTPPPGRFDGVIGGPPCQPHSRLAHMARYMGYEIGEDLIPEFERCVASAAPEWFLMENVEAAPEPNIPGYYVTSLYLNNRWLGEVQNRLRKFAFGHRDRSVNLAKHIEVSVFEPAEFAPAVLASGTRELQIRFNGGGKQKRGLRDKVRVTAHTINEVLRLQGLPEDFFRDGKKDPTFTIAGKTRLLGNGVPVPMARALASAIKEALNEYS